MRSIIALGIDYSLSKERLTSCHQEWKRLCRSDRILGTKVKFSWSDEHDTSNIHHPLFSTCVERINTHHHSLGTNWRLLQSLLPTTLGIHCKRLPWNKKHKVWSSPPVGFGVKMFHHHYSVHHELQEYFHQQWIRRKRCPWGHTGVNSTHKKHQHPSKGIRNNMTK